jgi:hypothetical protein
MKNEQNNTMNNMTKGQIIHEFIQQLGWKGFGFYHYEDLVEHCEMSENINESFDFWASCGIENANEVLQYVLIDLKK